MKVYRSISEPIRHQGSWDERWGNISSGLITSWERGREKSFEEPNLAVRVRAGELVVLPWKGGVEKQIKTTKKYGALNYLAMWQGLRGEDLCIDLDTEYLVTCTRTGMNVIFTSDLTKYSNQ